MSYISEETWQIQKHLAQKSLDSTGHLPEDGQPGGRFWDMVRQHYLFDVKTTGNDHRFLSNHCHFVDYWVPREFAPKPTPALPLPTVTCPLPVVCLPSSPPVSPPTCTEPPCHGHPGTPGVAVPEPPGIALAGIGLVIYWIGTRIIKRKSQ